MAIATPESKVLKEVIEYLSSVGAYILRPRPQAGIARGTPDVIACFNGQFLAIECKALAGKLSEAQVVILRNIRKSGGAAAVIRSTDRAEIIQDILDACRDSTEFLRSIEANNIGEEEYVQDVELYGLRPPEGD